MKKWPPLRRKILYIATGVFVLLNLFPPWETYTNPPLYDLSEFIGFRFILFPPNSPLGYESYVVIDFPVLFLEWTLFFVSLVLVLFLLKSKPEKKS